MNLDSKKTGAYIQMRRKLAGLTQMQLGERLHVTGQSVSNWERGLLLPDTATLPDLAEILDTSVDAILAGGDHPPRFRSRITVARMREAMGCIQRIKEILGADHFLYRTMIEALDKRMNSTIEASFSSANAMDAYVCEGLMSCIEQGAYVDRDDIRSHITNEKAAAFVLRLLDEKGMK